jgi:hypothetical protein
MRYRVLLVALLALSVGSCEEEELPTAPPVAKKAKVGPPASASVKLTRVDTTRASSICKATVRARGRARARLDLTPTDDLARNKATAYDALVADACK